MTIHQIWVTCAAYTPLSPRAKKPTPLKCTNISSVCPQHFPAPGTDNTPGLASTWRQSHGQVSCWDHPLALQAGKNPFKSIPHPAPAPCSPSAPREGAATSQARRIHKNHLDVEPAKVAPHHSVGNLGDGNHSLCYHVCWCFLISCKSGQHLGEVSELYLPKTLAFHKIKIALKA